MLEHRHVLMISGSILTGASAIGLSLGTNPFALVSVLTIILGLAMLWQSGRSPDSQQP